jgi:putative transposase
MRFEHSLFGKIMEPISRREFESITARHKGDHGVRRFRCWEWMTALIFAQLSGASSLRDIESSLNSLAQHHYHLGGLQGVRRSTFADANNTRSWEILRDVCGKLLSISAGYAGEGNQMLRLIDSSPISLRQSCYDWAEEDNRIKGLKLHTVYDPVSGLPTQFAISGAKTPDVRTGQQLIQPEQGVTYVFDKGYCDYNWWWSLEQAGAFFVTRLKRNANVSLVCTREVVGENIISDRLVRFTNKCPRGGKKNSYTGTLREITVARPDKTTPLILITNKLDTPAAEIAALYKKRWDIELLFKWLKQNLKIKKFLGTSENAVKAQIVAAMIAFLLLKLFHRAIPFYKEKSKTLLSVIKTNLGNKLKSIGLSPPQPRMRENSNLLQLSLSF